MIEKAFEGGKKYKLWLLFLLAIIAAGIYQYSIQLEEGLSITGMSRDVSWGFYVANFTFFVGVAASAVMLVIPYYLHHYKKFSQLVIFGEWLAVGSVVMCILFIFVDMGQPQRALNILLHPTPNSVLFWDVIVLFGYLAINLFVAWVTLRKEKANLEISKLIKFLILLSIPWAIAIHTVTAFLYSGLPGRHAWLTAIMAPRFLASAFAAGPALLILLLMVVKKLTYFKPEKEAFGTLAKIMLYGMLVNIFFYGLEIFTAFYSNIPSHKHTLTYLFFGLNGYSKLVPYVWTSVAFGFVSVFMLLFPAIRANHKTLAVAATLIFFSTYLDKGLALVIGGFIPSPLETITEYTITGPEFTISAGIWAIGALLVTLAYRMTLNVRQS
ncbi:MAG: sulfate reduction electron transfer complex DsrMKJOP subunit DsrP [Leptospirales bacterium]